MERMEDYKDLYEASFKKYVEDTHSSYIQSLRGKKSPLTRMERLLTLIIMHPVLLRSTSSRIIRISQ